ncbi:mechanosensitive ion channel domain-containing protein [Bacillus sp. FJAT-50079]|uniref:mechanosensitive ion channel domain-containing protein n=1 Tax=Bacillus sp. FJAT-50079 TaxID=2833577 RepID=UPI00201651C6|nr:mechanosensitive ion channel domain-containing protein [Bacillus sp. FJAT-50079]
MSSEKPFTIGDWIMTPDSGGSLHDTPRQKLENVVKEIEAIVKNHCDIHKEAIFVTFNEYKQNGLEIYLYFFTKTTIWGEFLKIKEEINFNIMDTLTDEGVSFALPSRRVYVQAQNEGDTPLNHES